MPKRIPHINSEMFNGIENARSYLEMQKGFGTRYLEEFLEKFKELNKTGRYLEAGPGPGYVTSLIAQICKPASITGLECSADMISAASEFLIEIKTDTKINFVPGAVEDTNVIAALGKFDLIYTTYSMHHWDDQQKGIKNLYDALDKNGVLFIFDYCRNGFYYYFKMKRRVRESIRASFRPDEIELMLSNLGITNYKISYHGIYLFITIYKD
jgi:SAM-dependent methyltransferase